MQRASILAVGKVYENDIGSGASSLSAGTANSKGFTDCLRKQNQLINYGSGDTATSMDTAGSRLAKLDRSALLRVPLAKNSRASKSPANDTGCDTMVTNADKTSMPLVTDGSALQAQPQMKVDANTTAKPATVDQQVIEAVADNLKAAGSALPLAVVKLPDSQTVQPAMEQDTADSSADTADMLITVANSNAAPEPQPREGIAQDSLIQVTKKTVLVADSSEKLAAEIPQTEGNLTGITSETTELSGQNNTVPMLSGKTVTPAQAKVTMVESKSPDSPLLSAITEARPALENVPAIDRSTQTAATEAGTDQPAQMATKQETGQVLTQLEDEKGSRRLEVDLVPPQVTNDLASQQPVTDRLELSQVSNLLGTVAAQPMADQIGSTEVTEVALGSAMPLEEVVAAVATPTIKPAQAVKGETKENLHEVKSDAAGAKKALEVFKAMAGKLEKNESNPSVQADKKENIGSGELKKLMEFESNRLQASPLKEASSGNGNLNLNDKQSIVTLTLLPQTVAISDVNPTQVAKLSAQLPLDAKTLIEQVVQKAELTVKANSSEMKIQLEPEFLGKLTIKIALEDGLLTARFTTENHQVKHLLESNLSTLRQSLEAQGIKVEKTEVNVQLDSGGTFGGYEGSRQDRWQQPETTNYGNSINFTGTYELTGEAELMETAFSQTGYYGIQTDGSMNFVV